MFLVTNSWNEVQNPWKQVSVFRTVSFKPVLLVSLWDFCVSEEEHGMKQNCFCMWHLKIKLLDAEMCLYLK